MVAITGMFGAKPRRFGLAGADTPQPAAVSPLANIMQPPAQFAPEMPVRGMTPDDLAPMPVMPDKKGFDWTRAIGILGDTLAGAAGGQPMYAQHLYQQKAMRERQQQQLAQLADERAYREQEWTRQKEWVRDNPEPQDPLKPTALIQNIEYLRQLDPDLTEADLARIARDNINAPKPIEVTNPETGEVRMVWPGMGGQTSAAPAKPVGKLKPYGGPTQPASGNFQR